MSYDSSSLVSVSFPVTSANSVQYWKAPKSGHLYDINLSTTTSWTGTTTPLLIEVGVTGDNDKFGELRAGSAGAGTAAGTALSARYTNVVDSSSVLPHADFLAGTNVIITVTGPTGTPAGGGVCTTTFQLDP